MNLIDTHCHIHDPEFFKPEEAEEALKNATEAGVTKLLCVATSLEDSKAAIEFAKKYQENCWATVGIHPHEAVKLTNDQIEEQLKELAELAKEEKVIAVGETGFDFYYNDKSEVLHKQTRLLEGQIEIALANDIPLSFHVREGFNEFWAVFEKYSSIRGVLHSFTDSQANVDRALAHGLYFGINGIATFTTHEWQRQLFKNLPLENVLIETDAPFLTPKPKRGTMNTPENVTYITTFLAELRGEDATSIISRTTDNARRLFGLS